MLPSLLTCNAPSSLHTQCICSRYLARFLCKPDPVLLSHNDGVRAIMTVTLVQALCVCCLLQNTMLPALSAC
jgi:hypothetical protein